MATEDQTNTTTTLTAGEGDSQISPLTVINQYIKDFSFENPNPAQSFSDNNESTEMALNLDIQANTIQDNIYEITLHLKAEAKKPSYSLFIAELQYSGIFKIGSVPKEAVHPILMIECPRILFPFARQILANVTREGGFPSLSLNPIDFVELYRKQYIEPQQKGANQAKENS